MNIPPVEGSISALTRSMQNIQKWTRTGCCTKYLCKYIENINDQNYVIIEVDGEGILVSKATFIHNTKVSSSKTTENKE